MTGLPAELKDFFTPWEPLGPAAAEHFPRALRSEVLSPVKAVRSTRRETDPPFIVGRRGSGKTAVLTLDGTQNAIDVLTPVIFTGIAEVTRGLSERGSNLLTKSIADIWDAALAHIVFKRALDLTTGPREPQEVLRRYLSGLVPEPLEAKGEVVAAAFCRNFAEQAQDPSRLLLADIESFTSDGVTLRAARAALIDVTATAGRYDVLLDSMEDFDSALQMHGRTMAGLLQLVGRDQADSRDAPFKTRMALPSELYAVIADLSGNPLKDLNRQLIIQWQARDLLQVAADRLAIGLELLGFFDTNADPDLLEMHRRGQNQRLLGAMLPSKVTNRLGRDEYPIAYLLRHTQLLPRHFILAMNFAFREAGGLEPGWAGMTEEALRAGVQLACTLQAQEIALAHRAQTPEVAALCERLLPSVGAVISTGDLHSLYNQTGAKKVLGLGFYEALQELVDVGVLGTLEEGTGRYVRATFSYTLPVRNLIPRTDDQRLCVHPIFSETYRSQYAADQAIAVYPSGADPDV